ncbi:MAG: hypothetical protein ACOYJS_05985, partial [Acutalibacteraceae bacterium]
MRFSFKKTLASILSAVLMLTTVLGALTASADVTYAGELTLENAVVSSDTTEFDVEATLTLNQETTFLALMFRLGELPEGVTLSSASIGSLGEATVASDKRLVLFDIGDISVSLVPITLTFTASGIAESFTISVVNYECADVSEEFLAIDITDTAEVQLEASHGADTNVWLYDENVHYNPCLVEDCDERFNEAPHTPAQAVVENEIPATHTEAGSYDSVVYCSVCRYEISRTTVEVPAGGHDYVYTDNGDGTHTVTCTGCDYEVVEEHIFEDGTCVCGAVEEDTHEHVYDGVAYMDPETHIWYKDCACGEASIETDPVVITGNLISNDLGFSEAVGSNIGINRAATGGIVSKGYTDYYVEIAYQSYAEGYVLGTKTLKLESDEYDYRNGAGTVDYFQFREIALYEMALDYTINLYVKDAEGRVVGMISNTTSVQKQALAYAQKYSSDIKLLTALVDMVNYGAVVQNFFAAQNPSSDIATAALPNVGFEAYQQYASDETDLPASFNDTRSGSALVETTLAVANPTLIIGASNSVKYQFRANDHDPSKLNVVTTYTNSYGLLITETVNFADLEVNVVGTNIVYTYVFNKLALYDLEKTVNVKLVYDGVEEYTYDYSVGNYANT